MKKILENYSLIQKRRNNLTEWIKMKKVIYEIKLEKSVKIILGIFAVGVFLNVFATPISKELIGMKEANAGSGHQMPQIMNAVEKNCGVIVDKLKCLPMTWSK